MFRENLTSDLFINFMDRLRRQSQSKVYLVVDNHPSHRSHATLKWVKEHADQIRLIFLPAYSPDLNPDEILNQDVKANAVRRQRPRDLEQLIANVSSYVCEAPSAAAIWCSGTSSKHPSATPPDVSSISRSG